MQLRNILSPDPKLEIDPIYNLVIAEEGHSPLKIFDHLNKRIGKPTFSSEDLIKFLRNSYLLIVTRIDRGSSLQGKNDSKIIKMIFYNDYNRSKGKIYNNDLARLEKH